MKKKTLVLFLSAVLAMSTLAGCGSSSTKKDETKTETMA